MYIYIHTYIHTYIYIHTCYTLYYDMIRYDMIWYDMIWYTVLRPVADFWWKYCRSAAKLWWTSGRSVAKFWWKSGLRLQMRNSSETYGDLFSELLRNYCEKLDCVTILTALTYYCETLKKRSWLETSVYFSCTDGLVGLRIASQMQDVWGSNPRLGADLHVHMHIHTHMHIYIYIYIYICFVV